MFVRVVFAVAIACIGTSAETAAAGRNCRAEVVAGSAAMSEAPARAGAIVAWRRAVITKYGDAYGDLDLAEANTVTCGRTMLNLYRCEIKARPCA